MNLRYLKTLFLLPAVLLTSPANSQAPQSIAPDLLRPVKNSADPMLGKMGALRQGRRVSVDFGLLERARPGQLLRLEFFKDTVYFARLVKREKAPTLTNGYHWHGTLEGKPGSQFIITAGSGGIASWFHTNDAREHTLTFEGNPREAYARVFDADAEHGSGIEMPAWLRRQVDAAMIRGGTMNSNNGCSDNRNQIFVSAAYTVLAYSQSRGSVPARVSNGIAQSNVVLRNSGLSVRLYLRRNQLIKTNAVEYTAMGTILRALTLTTDRIYDEVHSWRKTDNSDLFALIVGDHPGHGSTAGIAWRPGSIASMRPSHGFSVTEYQHIAGYTLTHEIGHNFGCAHDRAKAGANVIYPYAYGFNKKYYETGFPTYYRRYFYTVMSYRPSFSCKVPYTCAAYRQPVFSGTNIILDFGTKGGRHWAGSSTTRNNICIQNTQQTVANFSRILNGTGSARLITVRSSNPGAGVTITASRTDNHGRGTGATPFTREFCSPVTVTYTAPRSVSTGPFKRWVLNGVKQPLGYPLITLKTTRSYVAVAEYYTHVHGSLATFGTGCAGTNGKVPVLTGSGHTDVDKVFTIRISNARPLITGLVTFGASKTRWGSIPLPLDLKVIGMTGCTLDVSMDLQLGGVWTNSSGGWSTSFKVLNIPSTIGQHFYWQASLFDPGSPRATKVAQTNGLDLKVGGDR
jgi:Metallo-peptidase family M12